jgi:hypothetical protein
MPSGSPGREDGGKRGSLEDGKSPERGDRNRSRSRGEGRREVDRRRSRSREGGRRGSRREERKRSRSPRSRRGDRQAIPVIKLRPCKILAF